MRVALVVLALIAVESIASANGRVAVVDRSQFWDDGGIARWLAARKQLDAEHAKFVLVESPDGKPPPKSTFCDGTRTSERLCKDYTKIEHDQRVREAWAARENEVLEPIEADIARALEQFARAQRIELLLERSSVEIVFLAPSADITTAFIKHYNAKAKPRR